MLHVIAMVHGAICDECIVVSVHWSSPSGMKPLSRMFVVTETSVYLHFVASRRYIREVGLIVGCVTSSLLSFGMSSSIRVMILKGKSWAGRVTRMVKKRNAYRTSVGKPEGREHLKDLEIEGKMT